MPKCAVGCVDLGNVAEQFLCVWNDFHVFIMLTRYCVEDSSSKTYDFSPISQRMRLFCRLQRVFRNSWRKKCHWKKCSRNQIFTFLSFLNWNNYSKDASFDFETKERNLSHGFLHKGRSIEIYNKQCLVLSICKNSWCSLFIVQIGLFSWLTSWITLRVLIKASSVEISSQRAVCWLLQAGEI